MDATALLALYGTLRLTFSGSDRLIVRPQHFFHLRHSCLGGAILRWLPNLRSEHEDDLG